MRARMLVLCGGIIVTSWSVSAQTPEAGVAPVLPETMAPEVRPAAPPAPVVPETVPVLEKPKAVKKPPSPEPVVSKPVLSKPPEAVRVQETPERQPAVTDAKSIKETPVPAEAPPLPGSLPVEPPAQTPATPAVKPSGAFSFGCIAFSFAMLIVGIVAGFSWRHLASRRKLGGMHVRIGTWRGIP